VVRSVVFGVLVGRLAGFGDGGVGRKGVKDLAVLGARRGVLFFLVVVGFGVGFDGLVG
jgi:hypothetical protein